MKKYLLLIIVLTCSFKNDNSYHKGYIDGYKDGIEYGIRIQADEMMKKIEELINKEKTK